ncbi:MAG TPA: DUF6644 family protein [Sphingomonadaceae bacterium]|nr:DUF6644 family protein [Sphingomonadaceae bacterium]
MQSFSDWLYATALSTTLRETSWVVPGLQSIHILALAFLVGSALVTDLRLAGVLATDVDQGSVIKAYFSRIFNALLVLLLSGSLLVLIEPGRTLGNTLFWTKMGLILTAVALTWLLKRPLIASEGDAARPVPPYIKLVGWLSLLIWIAAIFCGRWIAYT